MSVRFFNAGFKINELMRFDHPTNDIKSQNLISYYRLEAESKDFFDVPTEVIVETELGEQNAPVRFADRIQKEYKQYGVVRINPKAKDISDDDNVALNEKDAKEKGERLWLECMKALVSDHERVVASAKANGQRPAPATGNTKYALKMLKIEDPANDIDTVLARKQDNDRVSLLEAELKELKTLLLQKKG